MEHVILHPLPLIAISDYVVRHTLRKLDGPVVGVLLGQQNGREVSIEFAYEAKTTLSEHGDVKLDLPWFDQRLEQMRAVHLDRNLDLVGWFTQVARGIPGDNVWPVHNQILERNESAILLGLHADEISEEASGGKLPVTIYETNYGVDETTNTAKEDGEDKEMKDTDGQLKLTFRQISFVVETGEAEMISMRGVASGATNATSAQVRQKQKDASDVPSKGKGKAPQTAFQAAKIDPSTVPLSKEDDDMVAAIQTKANAIKMLKSRIDLLVSYLKKGTQEDTKEQPEHSQTLLRLIQALVHRLSLVESANAEELKTELIREENDAETIMLLNELMSRVNETRDVGKKFSAIESGKAASKQFGGAAQQYAPFSHGPSGAGPFSHGSSGAGDLAM